MNAKILSYVDASRVIPYSGVPIFATEVRGYNPESLLSFVDLTTSVIENDPQYNYYEVINPTTDDGVEYILPERFRGFATDSLLVTDRTSESKYVDFTLPLYYQYQLQYDQYIVDNSLPDGFILIRKNMESVVSFDNYVVETREYPTSSGRYINSTTSGFAWGSRPVASNITTSRILLPIREKDYFYTVEYNRYFNSGIKEYFNELISEKELYREGSDYTITPSSIILTAGTNIGSGVPIYVQRNPDSFIRIKKPATLNDKIKEQPWNIQVSCGNFVHSSGILGGNRFYHIQNYNLLDPSGQIVSMEVPQVVSKNVLKLAVSPLLETTSGYPNYGVSETIISGTIAGKPIQDYITSIDYKHGYVYVNKDMSATDAVIISYVYDDTKTILSSTLDLNPRNTINAPVDIATNAIGLVIVPSGTIFYNNTSTSVEWSNFAYYKLNDNFDGNFDSIHPTGYAIECMTNNDILGPISGVLPSGTKLLGFFATNSISKDMVKTYDLRHPGGYETTDVRAHCSGWRSFSDIGFWDGEAFPVASTILIQIPSGVYNNIYNIFDANLPVEIIPSSYTKDLERVINKDTYRFESREQQVELAARKYIRDTIERYLPVGFMYIVVNEDFKSMPLLWSKS